MNEDVRLRGFALIPGILSPDECARLRDQFGMLSGAGSRRLLTSGLFKTLAHSERILQWVRPHLPSEPRPVRGICFDKSPNANWIVSWHQDITLALRGRGDHADFGPWSIKDGIHHVQAPAAVLEQMLTVRIHLDAAGESNGALRVLPGTHRLGKLNAAEIKSLRSEIPEHLCQAASGDALLMRPLLLHASGRTIDKGHRRILHIEYAGCELPPGMEWQEPV